MQAFLENKLVSLHTDRAQNKWIDYPSISLCLKKKKPKTFQYE